MTKTGRFEELTAFVLEKLDEGKISSTQAKIKLEELMYKSVTVRDLQTAHTAFEQLKKYN